MKQQQHVLRLSLHMNEESKENHANFQQRWLAFRNKLHPSINNLRVTFSKCMIENTSV